MKKNLKNNLIIGTIVLVAILIILGFSLSNKQEITLNTNSTENETKNLEYIMLCDTTGSNFIKNVLLTEAVYSRQTNLSCIYYNSPKMESPQAILMIFATPYKTNEEAKKAFDLNKKGRCQVDNCINPLLGDDSIWTGEIKGGGMYILKNSYYVKIEFPYAGDKYRNLEIAKKIGAKVISLI